MITRTLVDVYRCICERCKHEWRSEELSARCPKCKSPAWNKDDAAPGRPKKVKEEIPPEPELTADDVPIESQSTGKPLRDEKPGKCPHHKMRGELCYKCDKKFGLPVIKKIGA